MQNFMKIAEGVNVLQLRLALQRQPELFGRYNERKYAENGPHGDVTDIWLRHNDRRPFVAANDFTKFNDEHDSVWYPEAKCLPEARPIIFGLMALVEGERLGGILITKLPPGGRIAPHIDPGWHAGYYDKYHVAVNTPEGSYFGFEEGPLHTRNGDVSWFRNDRPHWVVNDSNDERISMIICIRHSKGPAW